MKEKRNLILLITCFLVASCSLSFADGIKLHLFPVFGYSPETDFIFGFSGLGVFHLGDGGGSSRTSDIRMFGSYTLEEQYKLVVENTVFIPADKWLLTGKAEANQYPELFWGIGNNTKDKDETKSEYGSFSVKQKIYRQISGDYFSGPVLEWSRQYNLKFNGSSDYTDIPGYRGHTSPGIGWGILFDSRDSSLSPSEGFYLEASVLSYMKALGGDYNYRFIDIDLRKYFQLCPEKRDVFAMQLLSENSRGDVPLGQMRKMGGPHMLRGYYRGRYRDKQYLAFQSELRMNLFGRFGVAFFGAAGNVGKNSSDIFSGDLKYSAGAGIRYVIIEDNGGSLRFDYGMGKDTSGFYITFGEAF